MTLKDRFENYTQQPDPEVWNSIEQTLKHRAAVRRGIIIGTATVVVAAAVTLATILPQHTTPTQQIASNQTTATQASPTEAQTPAATLDNTTSASQVSTTAPSTQKSTVETAPTATLLVSTPVSSPIVPTTKSIQVATNQPQLAATSATAQPAKATVSAPSTANNTSSTPATTAVASKTSNTKANPATDTSHFLIMVPNAFSPNDPNTEDVHIFKARAMEGSYILSFKMFIYSRAGNLVYQSNDINQGWDGNYKGHQQPMGTYVYVIEYKDFYQGLKRTRGTITLIR